MQERRLKILVNFFYRTDLLEPFLRLRDDFEFILIYNNKKEDIKENPPFPMIFWEDYSTPYDLLRKLKPDKIVFQDINSFEAVGLNIAAKNKGISTYILEHGLAGSTRLEVAYQTEEIWTKRELSFSRNFKKYFFKLFFYLSSFRFKNIQYLPKFLSFIYFLGRYGLFIGLDKCKFRLRNPTKYINFTLHNAEFCKIRDKATDEDIIEIGNPYFDKFFANVPIEDHGVNGKYYLLIDAPLELPQFGYSIQDKLNFYAKLKEFALRKNRKLMVKLHPLSYTSGFTSNDGVEFLQALGEEKFMSLITQAEGCFSFFSSLTIPVVCYKKCYIFFLQEKLSFQEELKELGAVKLLPFKTFKSEEIDFDSFERNESILKKFVEYYLYRTDGQSLERLKKYLKSDHAEKI